MAALRLPQRPRLVTPATLPRLDGQDEPACHPRHATPPTPPPKPPDPTRVAPSSPQSWWWVGGWVVCAGGEEVSSGMCTRLGWRPWGGGGGGGATLAVGGAALQTGRLPAADAAPYRHTHPHLHPQPTDQTNRQQAVPRMWPPPSRPQRPRGARQPRNDTLPSPPHPRPAHIMRAPKSRSGLATLSPLGGQAGPCSEHTHAVVLGHTHARAGTRTHTHTQHPTVRISWSCQPPRLACRGWLGWPPGVREPRPSRM